MANGDVAHGCVNVVGTDGAQHLINADAACAQFGRIGLNLNLASRRAVDVHRRNAGHVFHAPTDHLFDDVGEVRQCSYLGRHTQRHDRSIIVAIGLRDKRLFRLFRKTRAYLRELVAHLLHRDFNFSSHREFDNHQTRILARAGGDFLDARDRIQRVFNRLGQVVFDRLRACAGVLHDGEGKRQIHLGHRINRQPEIRHCAHDHERKHDHGAEHRIFDRNASHPHDAVPFTSFVASLLRRSGDCGGCGRR